MFATRKTTPCLICGEPTPWMGTQRCDRCYELEKRVRADPDLARQILEALDKESPRQPEGPEGGDFR